MSESPTVRWWRAGDSTRMSLIHIVNDAGANDVTGRTACGKEYPRRDVVPGPHHELTNEDGTPDEEDRLCRSCLRATERTLG